MPYKDPEDFRKYQAKRAAMRMALARDILGGKCFECGRRGSDLQVHHRDPKKKTFTPSAGGNLSEERLRTELKNCVLLCPTCHTKGHNKYGHQKDFLSD